MSSAEDDFETFTLISTAAEEATRSGLSEKLQAGRDWLKHRQAGLKPWGEFFNVRNVSRPASVGEVTSRLLLNLKHYHANYLFVFLGLALYTVITNPMLLFVLAFWVSAFWYISIKHRGDSVSILGRQFSPAELYLFLGVGTVPVCYFAGAGGAIFWIIGVSVVIILAHATLMPPPSGLGVSKEEEGEGIVMEEIIIS